MNVENNKVTNEDILPLRKYIGEIISTYIKMKGLSFQDVGDRIDNFDYMYLYNIIGKENFDINHFLKTLEALDLTLVIKPKRE